VAAVWRTGIEPLRASFVAGQIRPPRCDHRKQRTAKSLVVGWRRQRWTHIRGVARRGNGGARGTALLIFIPRLGNPI